MESSYYPIMLKLDRQRIVVIGGGNIAARKVNGLLEGGAQGLTVVAPSLCSQLQRYAEEGRLTWVNACYEVGVLQAATLVIAATDDQVLNEQISNDALACDILVCNVSDGKQGSFITPAAARHHGLTIAISSGGSSPSLVKHMKQDLLKQYLPRYEQAQRLLERMRRDVLASSLNSQQRQVMLEQAAVEAVAGITESYEQWFERLYNRLVQNEGED